MTLTTGPAGPGPGDGSAHDDHDDDLEQAAEPERSGLGAWIAHAPAERAPALGIPAVWTAAEILHAAGVSPAFTGAATVAAAGLAYGIGERRVRAEADRDTAQPGTGRPRIRGAELAAAAGGVGLWATAAAIWGPLAGPYGLLSLVYGGGVMGGYWWLATHTAVRAARARRDAAAEAAARAAAEAAAWREKKAQWHALAIRAGMPRGERSHLLDWSATPLGETWLVTTAGTGHRASALATRDLAERLAELGGRLDGAGWPLPPGRVEVRPGPVAGQLRITVRDVADPWARPVMHPLASGRPDPAAPYAELARQAATICKPVAIGVNPETAAPMLLPLREAAGARHVMVTGATGTGKTMVLDTIRVDLARAPDARFFQINLVKPRAERRWVPLAEGSALAGDADAGARALAILDFLCGVIARRGQDGGQSGRMHQPTPAEPQWVVIIDEAAGAAADPDRRQRMQTIVRAGRENGVSLVLAGQRPVQAEIGGVAVRANTNYYVYGAMIANDRRRGHGSDEVDLPDMGSYGEGAPGVFGIAKMNAGAASLVAQGRAFFWGDDTAGLDQLTATLAAARQLYVPEPAIAGDEALMALYAAATGGPLPATGQYDLATTRDGATVPGTAGVRGKLAAAAQLLGGHPPAAGEPGGSPPGPPAETDSQAALGTLRALVARPGGVSVREAAAALPYQKTKAHELLAALVTEGFARPPGKGPAARYYAATPPAGPDGPYPPLHAVPDDPGDGAQDAS